MAQKKTYTAEQKAEILKKASETSITEASKKFGVDRKTIRSWKASDSLAAEAIEVKKKTRAAGRKVKGALTTAAEKAAGDMKTAAEKAVKLNMVFQSPWGSEITPEQIALKVPKESTDVYVKIDENKIYWVGKNGETGAVDIW